MKHENSAAARNLQNVTITLPRSVIQEAKHMALDRGLSLSAFMAQLLEEKLERTERYREAMEREFEAMEHGVGSVMGPVTWTRDELHER